MSIILEMKSHQNRSLTKEKVDRPTRVYYDWLASALQHIFERNEGDCDSIFAGKNIEENGKEMVSQIF